LVLFGLFFTAMGVFVALVLRRRWQLARASESWPSAEGRILSSTIVKHEGSFTPKISYEYSVKEEKFTGDEVNYNGLETDQETAAAYVAKYPAGLTVRVFYDAEEPQTSVLEPGLREGGCAFLPVAVVTLVLFSMGVGFLYFHISAWLR
jgi:hypothetical protein